MLIYILPAVSTLCVSLGSEGLPSGQGPQSTEDIGCDSRKKCSYTSIAQDLQAEVLLSECNSLLWEVGTD